MPRHLILHIGQSKTGTSSIQRCLGARRGALRAEGAVYPRSPGAANHGLLPASLVPLATLGHFHPHLWEGLPPEVRLERFRREFAEEMDELGPEIHTVILSAEQCEALLRDIADIARLHDLVAPWFSTVRVIVYLRRQDLHFASGYTQALRVAEIATPALPKGGPETHRGYDYAAVLDAWAGVFGEGNVIPRVFEPAALLEGDVVDDFFALCELQVRPPPDDPERRSNLSVTPGALALMRVMGERLDRSLRGGLTPESLIWRRFAQTLSQALPGEGWRPSAAESEAFLARFEAVNETVRRRWFPERERLFSVDVGACSGGAFDGPEEETAAALEAACAVLTAEIELGLAREAQTAVRLARLQVQAGDRAAARSSYAAALRASPDLPLAHFGLAQLELAAGDVSAAQDRLVALRRRHPQDPSTERLARRIRAAARATVDA